MFKLLTLLALLVGAVGCSSANLRIKRVSTSITDRHGHKLQVTIDTEEER